MSAAGVGPALIAASGGEAAAAIVRERVPGAEIIAVDDPAALPATLDAHRPAALYAVNDDRFTAKALRPAFLHPALRWAHVGGSGVDHVPPLDRGRVTLTNSAGVLAPYLADTVIAAMLHFNARFGAYEAQRRERTWRPLRITPLSERTLLVVGAGEIGGRVAERARVLGLRVLALRANPTGADRAAGVGGAGELRRLLPRADYVSLHVRLNDATRGMIGAAELALMKPGAILINTARGPVVDEAALIGALGAGRIGGAYLDVFATEPLPETSPLWTLPNVLLTPHAADNITGWEALFARVFADNLGRWRRGEPLVNLVGGRAADR